jgi:hypothetical protein
MDLAQILGQLWRRRILVALSAVIAVLVGMCVAYTPSFSPVGFHKRSLEIGAASTTLVVDSRQSAALDIGGHLDLLAARAPAYGSLASSDPVISRVARRLHIPSAAIVSDPGLTGKAQQQSAIQRQDAVLNDLPVYRLSVVAVPDQPLLSVSTQAPTAGKAVRLANAVGPTLQQYIVKQQAAQHVLPVNRVVIRQLGAAKGGTLNSGANPTAALLGGLATFVALSLLILFTDRLRTDMRRKRVRVYDGARAPVQRDFSNGAAARTEVVDPVSDAVADRRRSRTGA